MNPFRMSCEYLVEVFEERLDLPKSVLETLPIVELVDNVNSCSWVTLKVQKINFLIKLYLNKVLTHQFYLFAYRLH